MEKETPFSGLGLLENRVMHYAWGSRTAIPRLLGADEAAAEPWAELWMGAHKKAPSCLVRNGERFLLDRWIAQHPEEVLGTSAASRYGSELPFLFKILAADEPLSIQVHPDRRQAWEGFERENREGVPLDGLDRNFRDPNHKPELLVAVTPFEALKGFRPAAEIGELLGRARVPIQLSGLQGAADGADPQAIRELFRALFELPAGAREQCLEKTMGCARTLDGAHPAFEWVARLGERYRADIGVLAPLFMNLVRLDPGEGFFVAPGELHAYLGGVGLELMANSDNVVRAGLTGKRIDLEGLLGIARFEPHPVEVLQPRTRHPLESVFEVPAEEFGLSRIALREGDCYVAEAEHSVEILLCIEGEALIRDAVTGEVLRLREGSSALVAAAVRSYTVQGRAVLYRAYVPEA
ncbi:Mannose-6-phosphate isomerase, class I [uncultured Desulfatiglans sp.]|uniref:mannose-6-phosphate isomerase n=1 Tax=Uncultured Desulfatiglans sp. TaxID=1748965 RepID=A0A653A7N3_UNCDX|nr:Mannose-6-phosphate isomerase, class I [uncultured Desulfatiglans sp.]